MMDFHIRVPFSNVIGEPLRIDFEVWEEVAAAVGFNLKNLKKVLRIDYTFMAVVEDRLAEMQRLKDDQDAEITGAVSQALHSIFTACCVPNSRPPQLVRGNDGSVHAEWHERSVDVEIAVCPDGTIHIFARADRIGKETEIDLEFVE